jgi:hypothetical protein
MKNKYATLAIMLFLVSQVFAQKELWGYRTAYNYLNPETPGVNDGQIVKVALDGTNPEPEVMHTFDVTGMQGKFPRGRLLEASNGKLYGVTGYAGYSGGPDVPLGVLFEYDPVTSVYQVLYSNLNNALFGLIEPTPGVLYGTVNAGNSIFKYVIATGTFSVVASIPGFAYNNSINYPKFQGELTKASDGFLYGVTGMAPSTQNIPFPGGIYRFNMATNQLTKLCVFGFDQAIDVIHPVYDGKLVEGAPGKLYGTSLGGSHFGPQGVAPLGTGTIFEFDIATSTLAKKFDFNYNTDGIGPSPLMKSGDKLYGGLFGLLYNPTGLPNQYGALFAYDLNLDTLSFIHVFDATTDPDRYPSGMMLKASNGNFYGRSYMGNYQFDPSTNLITEKINEQQLDDASNLIEICRKPNYRPSVITSFNMCEGSPFYFDVHNTNATSFVWKKGNTVLPDQTSGVLFIPALTLADTGSYTCEMTNECGVTIVPAIALTVNAANASTITSNIPIADNAVMICPGSTITLSGNTQGGIWSTGETTPTIVVSEAGAYSITNTNTCGNTYSNTVVVGVYETQPPIVISYDPSTAMCLGAPITFFGNVGGLWEDGSSGATFTTTIDTTTAHVVTRTDQCGTVTSNVIQFSDSDLFDLPVTPEIIVDGLPQLCEGSSIVLASNHAPNDFTQWYWYTVEPFGYNYVSNADSITVTEPKTYVLVRNSFCYGEVFSEPVTVTVSSEAPAVPIITVNGDVVNGAVIICQGETVTLQSDGENNVWSNGETTSSITVSTDSAFSVTASNGCGLSTSDFVFTTVISLPDNTITQNLNSLTANAMGMSYQWLDCAQNGDPIEIPGQTAQTFIAETAGSYAVRVTNSFGCESISGCFAITDDLGVPSSGANPVILVPNPAIDTLTVVTALDIDQVTIANMLGQIVMTQKGANEVNVSQLPTGQYILTAQTASGIWKVKFLKK